MCTVFLWNKAQNFLLHKACMFGAVERQQLLWYCNVNCYHVKERVGNLFW